MVVASASRRRASCTACVNIILSSALIYWMLVLLHVVHRTSASGSMTCDFSMCDGKCARSSRLDLTKMRIACVGDSITSAQPWTPEKKYGTRTSPRHSYPDLLQNMLGATYHVENLGLCGGTVLKRPAPDRPGSPFPVPFRSSPQYRRLVEGAPWDAIVFMWGTNAAVGECKTAPYTGCAFLDDYASLIAEVRSYGRVLAPHVVLVHPPPAVEVTYGRASAFYDLNATAVNTFVPTVESAIAAATGSQLVRPFEAMWRRRRGGFVARCSALGTKGSSPVVEGCELFCGPAGCDGVHPNDLGNERIARAVHETLAPERSPSTG